MNTGRFKSVALKALARLNAPKVLDDFEMFEIDLLSTPVVARTRKLRVRWTNEEDQTIQVEVHPDAEDALRLALESMR